VLENLCVFEGRPIIQYISYEETNFLLTSISKYGQVSFYTTVMFLKHVAQI